jgi:hypothetical protein
LDLIAALDGLRAAGHGVNFFDGIDVLAIAVKITYAGA